MTMDADKNRILTDQFHRRISSKKTESRLAHQEIRPPVIRLQTIREGEAPAEPRLLRDNGGLRFALSPPYAAIAGFPQGQKTTFPLATCPINSIDGFLQRKQKAGWLIKRFALPSFAFKQ